MVVVISSLGTERPILVMDIEELRKQLDIPLICRYHSKGTVNYIDFIKPQVHTAPTSRCRLFVLDTALQPSVREEVE